MIPDGFTWKARHLAPLDRDLLLDGTLVAQLMVRVDGEGWVAFLDRHWPIEAPLLSRPCECRESGIAGLQRWAEKHRERLRAEIARPALQRWRVAVED